VVLSQLLPPHPLPLPLVQLVLPHLLPTSSLRLEPAQPRLSLPPLLSLAPPGLGDPLPKAEGFLLGTALGTLQVSFICGWETIGGTGTSLTFLDAIRSGSTLEAAIVAVLARDERELCVVLSQLLPTLSRHLRSHASPSHLPSLFTTLVVVTHSRKRRGFFFGSAFFLVQPFVLYMSALYTVERRSEALARFYLS
jgi:hypothetical protein